MENGGKMVLIGMLYMAAVLTFLTYVPFSCVPTGATIATAYSTNTTLEADGGNTSIRETFSFVELLLGLILFNIPCISAALSIFAVYLPVSVVTMGIVLIIRGGS